MLLCKRHNDMSCRHKRFLIGKRNILACLDRCNRRADSDHSHDRGEYNIRLGQNRNGKQTIHARQYLHLQITDTLL